MRFIPPVITIGEQMFSDVMKLISDPKKYKKRIDEYTDLKKDAVDACKKNNDQVKVVEDWERDHQILTDQLDAKYKSLDKATYLTCSRS